MSKKRKNQALPRGLCAGVYIDGFNLYYAVSQLKKAHLKWISLHSLAEIFCKRYGARLETVVLCTAEPEDDGARKGRHKTFCTAQKALDVKVIPGHYMERRDGRKPEEKQSDINLALSVILDAEDGKIDLAIVLSADSDQAATAKHFRRRFPKKYFVTVAPPFRAVSEKIELYAHDAFVMTPADLEACVLGESVTGKSGRPIPRPSEYRKR